MTPRRFENCVALPRTQACRPVGWPPSAAPRMAKEIKSASWRGLEVTGDASSPQPMPRHSEKCRTQSRTTENGASGVNPPRVKQLARAAERGPDGVRG